MNHHKTEQDQTCYVKKDQMLQTFGEQGHISKRARKIINDPLISNFKFKQLQFSTKKEPKIDSNIENQLLSRSMSSIQSPQNEILDDHLKNYNDNINGEVEYFDKGFSNSVWKKGSLRILYIVSKFIFFLLINSEKQKFPFMNKHVFQTIHDRGSDFEYYLQNGYIRQKNKGTFYSRLIQRFQRSRIKIFVVNFVRFICLKFVKVILPDSFLKIIWDVVVMTILIINITCIPLRLAFNVNVHTSRSATIILDYLPYYIFFLEIILNFNTAFYSHGVIITNKNAIASNYVKGNFFTDVLVTVIFFISKVAALNYLDFIIMFRIIRVVNIFENLEEILTLRERFAAVLDVSKLISSFMFVCHFIACAWFYIGSIEPDLGYEQTWIYQAKIQDKQWYSQYITSLYWSIITTLTIGYGDIVGQTELEKVFIIFVGLTSSIMFGYIITDIGQIFQQIGENKKRHRDKMSLITSYITTRGLNKELQIRVKKFFEYYLTIDQQKEKECENLINIMGDSLKQEVKIDLYKSFLVNSFTLKTGFSKEFIDQLCQVAQEKLLLPEEIIFSTEEQVSKIYFIIDGEVELYVDNSHPKNINTIRKGAVFGERSFLTEQESLYCSKSKYFTRIGYITAEDFQRLLNSNLKEKEKYFHIKHQIMLDECMQFKGCELCYRSHDFTRCIFTFYRPDPRKIQTKNPNQNQGRQSYRRSLGGKYNTLQFLSKTQGSLVNHWLQQDIVQENQINSQFFDLYGISFNQIVEDSKLSQKSFEMPYRKNNRQPTYNTSGSPKNQIAQIIIKSKQFIPFESKKLLSQLEQNLHKTDSMVKLSFTNDPFGTELELTPLIMARKSKKIYSFSNCTLTMLEQVKLDYMDVYYEDKCPNFDLHKEYQYYCQKWNIQQVIESLTKYQNHLLNLNPKFKRYFTGGKGSLFGLKESIRKKTKSSKTSRVPSIENMK